MTTGEFIKRKIDYPSVKQLQLAGYVYKEERWQKAGEKDWEGEPIESYGPEVPYMERAKMRPEIQREARRALEAPTLPPVEPIEPSPLPTPAVPPEEAPPGEVFTDPAGYEWTITKPTGWDVSWVASPESESGYAPEYSNLEGWRQDQYGSIWTPEGGKYTPEGGFVSPEGNVFTPEQVKEQKELIEDLGRIFSEEDVWELMGWAESDPERFTNAFQEIGDTAESRAALKRLGASDEYIESIYPPIAEVESKLKDIWDAFYSGAAQMWHQTKQYFVSTVPEFFLGTTGKAVQAMGLTPEIREADARMLQGLKNTFRGYYRENKREYEDWVTEHPELKPRPEWEGSTIERIKSDPSILKDPAYWGYVGADSAAFMLAFLGTTLAVTAATGNPLAGMAAGVAITTPAQTQDLYEDLLANGATEGQAAQLSLPIGTVISSVEALGAFPLLKAISPAFSKMLRKEIQTEVAKQTIARLTAKGLWTFTQVEIAETMEEVVQQSIQNATVKTINENRDILEGLDETVIRTLMATAPFAVLGGGASMRRVSPTEAAKLTPEQKESQGWQRDEETGDWLKPEAIPTGEDIKGRLEKDVLMELPDSEKLIDAIMVDSWHRKALREAAKLPPAKKIIEWGLGKRILVNRQSAEVEDIVGRGRFLHSEIARRGESAQALIYWRLQGIEANPVELFGFDKQATSPAEKIKRLTKDADGTIEDIFTQPQKYQLNDKQRQYVERVHEINQLVENMMVKEGVTEEEVGNDWWMHRVVIGKYDANDELIKVRGRPGVKRGRIGAKVSFEMHRKAPTMAEGIAWNIVYGKDPRESVATYTEEAFKKIADARFEKYLAKELEPLAKMGVLPREELLRKYPEVVERAIITAEELADANSFTDKINRTIRGEKLTEQTLQAIERRFPELGGRFRALAKEPVFAEKQLREILAQSTKLIRDLTRRIEKAEKIDVEAIKAEARREAVATGIPDEQKLTEAFKLMDYQDRLAFRSTMEGQMEDIGRVGAEQETELGGIEEFLKSDPVAQYRGMYGKQKRSLMSLLHEGQWPETLTQGEARIILMGRELKPAVINKEGRVPWHYVVDELADHFSMTEQQLIDRVEQIASYTAKANDLRALVDIANDRYKGIKYMLEILDRLDTQPEFIPKAEAGMPEAGLQEDIFGYTAPVFPKGKGEVTQISMEEYGKLTEIRKEAGLPPPDVGIKPKIEGVKGFEKETQAAQITFDAPIAKTATQRAEALKGLRDEVKALTEARRAPFWEARAERKFRMEQVSQPGIEEGYIMHPFAGGRKFDQDFIDAFNKFFGHDAGLSALRVTADSAGILRILKAALDFSQPAIQGTLPWGLAHSYLMTNPKVGVKLVGAWYKSFFMQVGAFFNPGITARFMEKHKDSIARRGAAGGGMRAVFMFQEMAATVGKGTLAKWGEKGLAMIPLDPYHRAETSFFTGGEVVRDTFWEIFEADAVAKGKEGELAHFLDILTGIADPRAMGVPMTVRQLEQSFVFFSSAYTRSYLTVVAEIFRGGMTGAQARRALAGFVTAGAAYFTGVQYALSTLMGADDDEAWEDIQGGFGIEQDPITGEWAWKPTAKFMSIKVGDTYFGVGGGVYGLMRLAGNIAATVQEVGEREIIDLVRIMKHGSLNKRDNPFISWWYARSSALFSPIYEMATHRDFLGYPIETPEEYARYVISLFEPIWVEQSLNPLIPSMAGNREVPEDALETAMWIAGEVFGLRVNPEYSWQGFYNKANEYIKLLKEDKLEDWQQKAWRAGKLQWKHLTSTQQWDLLYNHKELYDAYEVAQADSELRANPHWKNWDGRQKEEKTTYYDRGNSLMDRLRNGEIDTYEMGKLWGEAGQNYGIALDAIEKEPTYEWIYDFFDRKREKGVKYIEEAFLALAEYQQVMFAEYLDEKGDMDWDARDRTTDEFIQKYGVEMYETIRQMYSQKKELAGLDPALVQRADDFDKLGREFWRLPYRSIAEMDVDDEAKGEIPVEFLSLWREYQTLKTREERDAFREVHPDFAKDWRAEYRMNNPWADAMLAVWGKGGKLQTKEAYDSAKQMAKDLDIPLSQIGGQAGFPPEILIDNYFDFNKIVAEHGGTSAEAQLYKLENKNWFEWGKQPENYGWMDVETPIQSLRISVKWAEVDDQYKSYSNRESENYIATDEGRREAREKLLAGNLEYAKDRRRRDAYDIDFPETLIPTYVDWYMTKRADYEDDWFLMENKEFYNKMVEMGNWQPRDFSKVPTRHWWGTYNDDYLKRDKGKDRYEFRGQNPWFDAEGVSLGKWKTYDPDRYKEDTEPSPPSPPKPPRPEEPVQLVVPEPPG